MKPIEIMLAVLKRHKEKLGRAYPTSEGIRYNNGKSLMSHEEINRVVGELYD